MRAPTFDYIIIGAGSAGSLLANRLSADKSKNVLLVEAGGPDDYLWIHVPVGYLYASTIHAPTGGFVPSRTLGSTGGSSSTQEGKRLEGRRASTG